MEKCTLTAPCSLYCWVYHIIILLVIDFATGGTFLNANHNHGGFAKHFVQFEFKGPGNSYIYIYTCVYIYISWYFPDNKPIPIFIYVLNFRCKNYSGFTTSILVHSSDPAFVHSVKIWFNLYVVQTVLMQVPTLIKLQFCYTVFMFTHPINAAYPLQLQSFA